MTSDAREQFEATLRWVAGRRLDPREIDGILRAADKYHASARHKDDVKPCGTIAAYRRHLRRGEPVDQACREAKNADRRAQPKSGPRALCVCGCGREAIAQGYGHACYKRWVAAGRPAAGPPPPMSSTARIATRQAIQQAQRQARLTEYGHLRSIGYTRDQAAKRLGVAASTARHYEATIQRRDAA